MTKISTYCLLSCALALTTSCASFYAKQDNVSEQITQWTDANKYDKALDTIAELEPDHPDFQRLTNSVTAIEKSRQKFVYTTLSQAKEYEATQDWVNAEETIQEGMKSIPESPELATQLAYYQNLRQGRINKDKAGILIASAYYFISARPHQESLLYNSTNRFHAQQRFSQFLQQAQKTSRELYALGLQYWQEDKIIQAREALTLSVKTAPNDLSESLLASVLEQEKNFRTQQRKAQLKLVSEQLPELESSFFERLKFDDFVGAQKILNEMMNLDGVRAAELQVTFHNKKLKKINQFNERAYTLYNSGYLEEAVIHWQRALLLDPEDNTIRQQLVRAEKFLDNLERWKEAVNNSETN